MLLVENAPVGNDDDGVEEDPVGPAQASELVGEPGSGVRLAVAGGDLNGVVLAHAVLRVVGAQKTDDGQLMAAWEYLTAFFRTDSSFLVSRICA